MIIMERMKKIYKRVIFVIALLGGALFTSCSDYLTIIPPSVVTHENFWKTEAEVRGMAATAYLQLCNVDAIQKSIVWGESRAETTIYSESGANDDLRNLMRSLLYDDNRYAGWDIYYKAINYCNLVIEYGPLVLEEDPSFSEGEMQVLEGQMKALRAYAHFVLLRAFCNIPLAITPVMADSEIPEYPQEHPMVVLDQIYSDLSDASNLVLKSDGTNKSNENLGYITTNAVYTLMADVNMWQAAFAQYYDGEETDYQFTRTAYDYYTSAIANCDYVLNEMDRIHKEKEDLGKSETNFRYNLITNRYDLRPDRNEGFYGKCAVYEQIFGTQNSEESIFEFQINKNNEGGDGIKSLYRTEPTGNPTFLVPTTFLGKFEEDDLRKYSFISAIPPKSTRKAPINNYVMKYAIESTPSTADGEPTYRKDGDNYANWIVYRKSDVMLMKAEALLLRSESPSTDEIAKAFDLAYAINLRWRIDTTATEIKNPIAPITQRDDCLQFVRDEKLRELCFEGKSWYDLVRKALMTKEIEKRLDVIETSYSGKQIGVDSKVMRLRYNDISALFMPISKREMTYNKLLIQNKSCINSDDTLIEGD